MLWTGATRKLMLWVFLPWAWLAGCGAADDLGAEAVSSSAATTADLATHPILLIAPVTHDFGGVLAGSTSAPFEFKVTQGGIGRSGPLNIGFLSIPGSPQFQVAS